jgi:hypothetical protein
MLTATTQSYILRWFLRWFCTLLNVRRSDVSCIFANCRLSCVLDLILDNKTYSSNHFASKVERQSEVPSSPSVEVAWSCYAVAAALCPNSEGRPFECHRLAHWLELASASCEACKKMFGMQCPIFIHTFVSDFRHLWKYCDACDLLYAS